MHLRALVFLFVAAALVLLPGGHPLFGAEPLPAAKPLNSGGVERRQPPAPAGTRQGSTGTAPARPQARPAAAADAAAGVSYQYDALGRIREIVRVPGR
jgi:hypothetical protein